MSIPLRWWVLGFSIHLVYTTTNAWIQLFPINLDKTIITLLFDCFLLYSICELVKEGTARLLLFDEYANLLVDLFKFLAAQFVWWSVRVWPVFQDWLRLHQHFILLFER